MYDYLSRHFFVSGEFSKQYIFSTNSLQQLQYHNNNKKFNIDNIQFLTYTHIKNNKLYDNVQRGIQSDPFNYIQALQLGTLIFDIDQKSGK